MDIRRFTPYIIGLVVLAFALGSLPRGSPGGSLLFQSYWLLYLIYLGPIAILAMMIALIIIIGLNWRALGNAIGFGLASKRRVRKKRSPYTIPIFLGFWALAIGVLLFTHCSIFNPCNPNTNANIEKQIVNDATIPGNPFAGGGLVPAISGLVQNNWFSFAFLGLLVVGGLVIFQTIKVSMKETSEGIYRELEVKQAEGLQAVHQAIKLLKDKGSDPRSRIMASYQHMITTVSTLGAPVSSDQTARELERAIRSTLSLKGPATSDLTSLFEEARYSLHEILDEDANNAHRYLESIGEELKDQFND